jgi:signal transduction histidine kinase/DNA-binding response OmpR family regulator/CBS domain-containing protein
MWSLFGLAFPKYMAVITLRDFLKSTPTCRETDSLACLIEQVRREATDQCIVVRDDGVPVGVVSARAIATLLLDTQTSNDDATVHSSPSFSAGRSVLASLRGKSIQTIPHLIEAVAIAPSHWSLSEFQQHCHNIHHPVVLVDGLGHYLGQIDLVEVWRFLATHPNIGASYPSTSPALPEPAVHWYQPPASDVSTPQGASIYRAPDLDSLTDILEHLPLPIMLQTGAGHVLTQNLAWRQQIGELRDPVVVKHAAAAFLEALNQPEGDRPTSSPSSHPDPRSLPNLWQLLQDSHLDSNTRQTPDSMDRSPHETGQEARNVCEIGHDANTCVCICSMQDGQEKVWQFIKIPMGMISSTQPDTLNPTPPYSEWGDRSTPTAFHLADLQTQHHYRVPPHWNQTLWLVLAQDNTEQRQVGRELAAKNADLIQLNRLKDEFLACISHELKTPLTAILGLSSLLKDQHIGALSERQARYAQLIHHSSRHLMLIVNDILDLTRIETGQLELICEPVDIAVVCDRAYTQARQSQSGHGDVLATEQSADTTIPESASHSPSFHITLQPGLDYLIADEMRLCQMLTNLLSNAIKFTALDGEVGLQVEMWDNWVAFTVWDTGIGIPAEKQHLIFQKFKQLENPLTRRFEGTGLGLVLTQRLARLHGGDVTFSSLEGKGSRFTLLLPMIPSQGVTRFTDDTVTQLPALPKPEVHRRLVLVMESLPQFLNLLTGQLMQLGYKVAIARSGTEALQKARRIQPAAIFLNPSLPLLSGWDVLVLLKSDPETQHIPIVVTTTRAEMQRAQQIGADGFLSLPIQADDLAKTLETILPASTWPQAVGRQPSNLTLLHLNNPTGALHTHTSHPEIDSGILTTELNRLLYPRSCRILEVDDLDQADLLARVWHPDLLLLGGQIANPSDYLHQLSQYQTLSVLPLVTLTADITQAANQISQLTVFPCLAPFIGGREKLTDSHLYLSSLIQVIQIAAGLHWMPYVLMVDLDRFDVEAIPPLSLKGTQHSVAPINRQEQSDRQEQMGDRPQLATESENSLDGDGTNPVEILLQYIQSSGFRCSVANSTVEVTQHLQQHSVDLMLLFVPAGEPTPTWLVLLQELEHLTIQPPLLVYFSAQTTPLTNASSPIHWMSDETQSFRQRLLAIAARHFTAPTTMESLMHDIRLTLGREPL